MNDCLSITATTANAHCKSSYEPGFGKLPPPITLAFLQSRFRHIHLTHKPEPKAEQCCCLNRGRSAGLRKCDHGTWPHNRLKGIHLGGGAHADHRGCTTGENERRAGNEGRRLARQVLATGDDTGVTGGVAPPGVVSSPSLPGAQNLRADEPRTAADYDAGNDTGDDAGDVTSATDAAAAAGVVVFIPTGGR